MFKLEDEITYVSKLVVDHECVVTERENSHRPSFPPIQSHRDKTSTWKADIDDFQEHVLVWIIRQHRYFKKILATVEQGLGKPIPLKFTHDMYLLKQPTKKWEQTTSVKMISCCNGISNRHGTI